MKYYTSEHFRDDPLEEISSALVAGNSPDSVRATLIGRLLTEEASSLRNDTEIKRINVQLGHSALQTNKIEIAA